MLEACLGNKYGVPSPLKVQKIKEFGDFDVWNAEIGILLSQYEAEKINWDIKPIFKYIVAYFPQNPHTYYICAYDFTVILLEPLHPTEVVP